MEDFSELIDSGSMDVTATSISDLVIRFLFNLIIVFGLSRWLYYPHGKRRDYLFVFVIISISIFLMVYLLGSLKLKIGFALGLFAIFGIVKYRTEQMPVREMTYLFVIISLSVINALSQNISLGQLAVSNALLIGAIWTSEQEIGLKNIRSKIILYDDPRKIVPERRGELTEDIKSRLGLNVVDIEVGAIDYTKDQVTLKVFYEEEKKK